MYTLFIDTHDTLITIAFSGGNKLFLSEKESDRLHSVYTLPMLKELMDKNSISFKDINEIIVVNGPGSFTGLRIGLSVVKTIGYSLNIPIKTISSLTAYLVSSDENKNKYAYIEDNKGYYISVFDTNNKPLIEEQYVENIEEYKNSFYLVPNKLDIHKIIEFSQSLKIVNVHSLKANYIKKIEVEK